MSLFDIALDSIQASIQGNDGSTLFAAQEDAEASCVVDQRTVERTWQRVVERLKAEDGGLRARRLLLLAFSRCVQRKNAAHKQRLHFIRALNFAAQPGAPQGTYVSLAGVRVINSVGDSLNSLVLRGCKTVTDAHLSELRGLRRLAILDVSSTAVGDHGIRELAAALPQLEALYCASTAITSNAGEHLRALSKLVKLDVSRTKFADPGVEALCLPSPSSSSPPPLDTLSLGFTRVTLACLAPLLGLERLVCVDFRGCAFAVQDLRARATKLARERRDTVAAVSVEIPLLLRLRRSASAPRMRQLPSDREEEAAWRVSFIRQLIAQGALEEGRAPKMARSTSFMGSPWRQRRKPSIVQEALSPGYLRRRNSSEILFGETPQPPPLTPKRRTSILFTTSPCTPGSVVKRKESGEMEDGERRRKRCRVVFPRRKLFGSMTDDKGGDDDGDGDDTEECDTDKDKEEEEEEEEEGDDDDDEFDVIDDIPFALK